MVRLKHFGILLLLMAFSGERLYAQRTEIRDANISAMVNEVGAANLEQIIKKLVSFQTRHTLSDTLSKTTGIGAART